jgi:hypothetical protein
LDDYFESEENNKRMLEHLFDGVDELVFEDEDEDIDEFDIDFNDNEPTD